MKYAETLAEIQQEKEALEVELMQSVSEILSDWQNKTKLAVNDISISVEKIQAFGLQPKSIVTDCNVDIKWIYRGVEMSEWISVEDRFPDFGVSVATIGKKEDGTWATPITAQLYDDGSGVLRFISGFSFSGDRLIKTMVETKATHWMPLPEPPK